MKTVNTVQENAEDILAEAKSINEENDRLSAAYDGNYGFVKTYTDSIEKYPSLEKSEILAANSNSILFLYLLYLLPTLNKSHLSI